MPEQSGLYEYVGRIGLTTFAAFYLHNMKAIIGNQIINYSEQKLKLKAS